MANGFKASEGLQRISDTARRSDAGVRRAEVGAELEGANSSLTVCISNGAVHVFHTRRGS